MPKIQIRGNASKKNRMGASDVISMHGCVAVKGSLKIAYPEKKRQKFGWRG